MDILIRSVEEKDYSDIVSIWNNELDFSAVTLENITVTFDKMKENSIYENFVAVYENNVIGLITTVEVLAVGFPVGYTKVNGLAVKKDFQGKGVGKQLLNFVENRSRARGISFIGLATGFQRKDAHAFYEKQGYKSGSYWFNKHLR